LILVDGTPEPDAILVRSPMPVGSYSQPVLQASPVRLHPEPPGDYWATQPGFHGRSHALRNLRPIYPESRRIRRLLPFHALQSTPRKLKTSWAAA
jgi:hypothetical protein